MKEEQSETQEGFGSDSTYFSYTLVESVLTTDFDWKENKCPHGFKNPHMMLADD